MKASNLVSTQAPVISKIIIMLLLSVTRWRTLQADLEERLRQLQEAMKQFGPNSQHLLSGKN